MTHWRLSEGNIDIVDGNKAKHVNLMTTVDFYKQKIDEVKQQFESSMLNDDRKYNEVKLGEESWKQFQPETKEDIYKIAFQKQSSIPTFEETMTIDTIKAMRRDRRNQK